jgi:hypothetical protein
VAFLSGVRAAKYRGYRHADDLRRHAERSILDTDALAALLAQRQPNVLTYPNWQTTDQFERAAEQEHQRPRIKLIDVEAMLDVA